MLLSQPKTPLHSLRLSGIALGLALAAQQAGAAGLALEEMLVTAQKRTESIQDTPISLAAFDSAMLEAKSIGNLVDLEQNVPNLQLAPTPTSSTDIRAFLRGIGNNDDQITQDPSVAIYMDGIYIARSQGLAMDIADIERIEVLRGPQGSLYGRNATGGAINFITRAPDLEAFGLKQTVSFGNRGLQRFSTRVNMPVADTFAVQASYMNNSQDGFVKNLGTGARHFGDKDRDAWRLDTLWVPLAELEVRYSFDRSNIHDTPSFIGRVPMFPQQGKRPSAGSRFESNLLANDVRVDGHGLNISWDLTDNLNLKSITSYRKMQGETNRKYLTGVLIPTFPVSESANSTEQDQVSQEFQLTGDAFDSRLEYVAGLYYFKEKADRLDISNRSYQTFRNVRTIGADNKAYAVFGQGTWTPDLLDDKLHITVGGRWSRDDRKASLQETQVTSAGTTNLPQVKGDNSFSNFSPTVVVAYDLAEGINTYAKVTRGYKSGGYNFRASTPQRFSEGFDEEQLTSYELGVKSQFWDNRLRLNAAVFRSDYDDIQINIQSDPTNPAITDVLNAGKARITGGELDLTARLLEGLTARVSYGYLATRYDEVMNAAGVNQADQFRFINAPRHSYSTDLEYRFPQLPFGALTALVGYSWQDEKYTSASVVGGRYITDDFGLLNARLSLSEIPLGGGEVRVALWGRNLEDKTYYTTFFNLQVPAAMFGEPRSYGIDLTFEY